MRLVLPFARIISATSAPSVLPTCSQPCTSSAHRSTVPSVVQISTSFSEALEANERFIRKSQSRYMDSGEEYRRVREATVSAVLCREVSCLRAA